MGVEVYSKNGQTSKKDHGGKGQKSKEHYGGRFDPFPSHNGMHDGYERNYTSTYRKKS
jgi:hypothetical protein